MGARIVIEGPIIAKKKIPHPEKENVYWYCFDFEEGGSDSIPRHLPSPSKVHYTVLFNERQMNKIRSKLRGQALNDCHLQIYGEITLDLPLSIVPGEIGVIASKVSVINPQSKDVAALEKTGDESGLTVRIHTAKLEEIKIPREFLDKIPTRKKIEHVLRHIYEKGKLDRPLEVKKTPEGFVLTDGYTRYVAAKELGIMEVEVII